MTLKKFKFIAICFIVFSCNKRDKEEYYPSGNIKFEKVYGQDDRLKKIIQYYDASGNKILKAFFYKKDYDSVVYFYNNNKVFKTGKQDKKGNAFGKWNYYTREGYLSNTKEFYLINDEFDSGYRLNQQWYYNKKGDTMLYGNKNFNIYNQIEFREDPNKLKRSIFVYFDFHPKGDTLSIAEPFRAVVEDAFPFWKNKGSESYVVLAKEKFNFNRDFSNERLVKLDTFYCVEKDKLNIKRFPKNDKKHTVVFGRWFDTPGKKVLRGYMVEHYKRKATTEDSIVEQERRTYFEKIIYVKDTVK